MIRWKNHLQKLSALFILALMLVAVGCGERKGAAEKTGETIDETIDDAKEKTEDVFDNDGPAEDAGEKVDETVDEATDEAKDAVN